MQNTVPLLYFLLAFYLCMNYNIDKTILLRRSDAIKIYHKKMKHTSEENEEVPDYMHIFYALRLVEEDADGVRDTAENEEDNAVHSDGVVIGLDGYGYRPARDNVEREADLHKALDVYNVKCHTESTAGENNAENGIAYSAAHCGYTSRGIRAEDKNIYERMIALHCDITDTRRLYRAVNRTGGMICAGCAIKNDERRTEYRRADDCRRARGDSLNNKKDETEDAEDSARTVSYRMRDLFGTRKLA